jgi:hypothetical protein
MANEVYGVLERQIGALQEAKVYALAVCEWVGRLFVGVRENRLEVLPYKHVSVAISELLDPHKINPLRQRLEAIGFLIEQARIPVEVPVSPFGRNMSVHSMKKSPSAHRGAVTLFDAAHGFLSRKVHELCPELGLLFDSCEAGSILVDRHWEALRRDLADVAQFDCDAIRDSINREAQAAMEVCNASAYSAVAGQTGKGAAASTPEQLATVSGGTREAVLRNLKPSVLKAYLAFQYAEKMKERRLEDREAHTWLKENGIDQGKGDFAELVDYKLPSFDTWGRQLRNARGPLGEQKYTRRAGRAIGSSIVRSDEIEYQRGDEE